MNIRLILFTFILFINCLTLFAQAVEESILLCQIANAEKAELEQEFNQSIFNCLKELFNLEGNAKLEISAQAFSEKEILILFESLKNFINSENGKNKELPSIDKTDLKQLLQYSLVIMPVLIESSLSEIVEKTESPNKSVLTKKSLIIDLYGLKLKTEPRLIKRRISVLGLKNEKEAAVQEALLALKRVLVFELGYFVEKGFKERLIKITDNHIYLSSGIKDGVLLGDEYEIYTDDKDNPNMRKIKGLAIVNEVTDLVSQASLLYREEELFLGDKVKKIERLGLELSLYFTATIPWRLEGEYFFASGISFILAKAVHSFRPILCLETILYPFYIFNEQIILRLFSGLELTTYFGRLQLSAVALFGMEKGFYYFSFADSPLLFSLRGMVNLSILFSKDLKIFSLTGYEYWFATRQGFIFGLGTTFKI